MLTLRDIEEKLKGNFPPMTAGDHGPDTGGIPKASLRKAAVLILLIEREDGIHILFTERTAHLSTHAGQVSFPGGGAEPQDKNMAHTALREAQEEIGLDPQNARVIGELPEYVTRSGFIVTPVVAVLEKHQKWAPDPNEVAALFDTPLEHILKTGEIREESIVFHDKDNPFHDKNNPLEETERRIYAIDWRDYRIWGATAGMLKNLADILSVKTPVCDVKGPEV